METRKGKTVFIEYSTANPGQHFLTVMQNYGYKRVTVARVSLIENKETKEKELVATDFDGKQIFSEIKDLETLKKKFIEQGESLAKESLSRPKKTKQGNFRTYSQKYTREQIIGIHRERFAEKSKDKKQEVSKTNKQDLRKIERTKDQEQIKEKDSEKLQEKEAPELTTQEPIQDEAIENEKSEREIELENIRDDKDDDRGDVEIDR
ncbi:MAG: hypothetical protein WC755_06295 [Candidatus Woesearchaeota archaeon]|jgi:hypothetical protein